MKAIALEIFLFPRTGESERRMNGGLIPSHRIALGQINEIIQRIGIEIGAEHPRSRGLCSWKGTPYQDENSKDRLFPNRVN